MAVDWQVQATRTDALRFNASDIKLKPELNGRHDLPDIEPLIADIVANGQLVPCLVRNDGGTPILIDGHSRWRAIVEINKRKLAPVPMKVSCILFKGSEKEAFLVGISCNKARNSTTPTDDGHNIARLERYGMSMQEIAAFYQEEESWCKKRLALVSLTEASRKAVKEGKVKPSAVTALAKLSEDQQREKVKAASVEKPLSNGDLKPAPKPSLRVLVKRFADGENPFPIGSDTVREFCGRLLLFEGK
jgi:ParB-like chromosome segregation protein Spo0J